MTNEEILKGYESKGWVIHPLRSPKDKCNSPGKQPILVGWQKLTKTPPASQFPDGCNFGIVCGKASGLTVLDFDSELFLSDVFMDFEIDTLKSRHKQGRGHIFFKYTPDLPGSKHHELGIEILSDGSNAVIPPSLHPDGSRYEWNKQIEPIAMPQLVRQNILHIFETERELKEILNRTRTCFRKALEWNKPNRDLMLALCTDLKANGGKIAHATMLSKILYKEEFNLEQLQREWSRIDPKKTFKCSTIESKMLIDCRSCKDRKDIDSEPLPQRHEEHPETDTESELTIKVPRLLRKITLVIE